MYVVPAYKYKIFRISKSTHAMYVYPEYKYKYKISRSTLAMYVYPAPSKLWFQKFVALSF